MELTNGQKEFLKEVEKGSNIFLTGKAGTGKSFVINLIKDRVQKLGSTGVSALNIGGITLHSYFWIPVKAGKPTKFTDCYYYSSKKIDQLNNSPKIILIDEASMIRADVLESVENTLKKNNRKIGDFKSLKSKQVIFVGDMKQLPPVVTSTEESNYLEDVFGGYSFKNSNIYKELNVKTIELTEIVRQSDEDFIFALNELREGRKCDYWQDRVNTEYNEGIVIAPKRSTVNNHNKKELSKLDTNEVTFKNNEEGTFTLKDFNLPKEVTLKHGCRVMYKHNSTEYPLVNGTLGTFIIKDGEPFIILDSGVEYPIIRQSFEDREYFSSSDFIVNGRVDFFPVEVAYAITIHKSQGLTFDKVNVDLSQGYFGGMRMLYVAFSRCRTPEGLNIIMKKH